MDPLWFKDAVFYQLHVKAFMDSNDDGMGDFRGLTRKLDYLQTLGVDTLWLLPFYPSPLKDDGYDISDYRSINPAYGSMRDFRDFVREAHARGLKVVTELVANHTSDQHWWFQRARRARPGSATRDWYVWSDTDTRYAGTRIIFTDTERSNWAWDDQAKAFYWHRFFSHQPDLNFANPRVVREMIRTMRFWLDIGVDGLRLDAVPYLCEREGTNNENLPETHAILKRLRAALDESHPGRIFIAEANQWPEDVLPYFGAGDECHMSFHFPLMPRMYMALAREDRLPITDILRQTPDIPDGCQWAVFLRNHDELTLEMVTDRERDYLWETYASDRRARVNVGIRRRLAPLMENDRRRIELLNSLLLSMPGTPIIYYGDEIGMGDNIFLGDRNGVRTPMQWNEDRNGGFSRADPASLFLPPVMDTVYGYEAVNVEAQSRNPSSLLNWMRRIIAVRRARKSFGRGTLRFLYPTNRAILVYLREYEDETVLCVANLARSAQGVELDLAQFRGRVPVELMGQSPFPPIGELPYFVTLPGYGFYWFLLSAEASPPAWHVQLPGTLSELTTLVAREGFASLTAGEARRALERDVLPAYLQLQRWYADKDVGLDRVELLRWNELATSRGAWLLATVSVRRGDGAVSAYQLPFGIRWDETGEDGCSPPGTVVARLRRAAQLGLLVDAFGDDGFALALLQALQDGASLPGSGGPVVFRATSALGEVEFPAEPEIRRLGVEQSNSSCVIGEAAVLKLIRRPAEGRSPEIEIGRYLTEVSRFANTPPLLGWFERREEGDRVSVMGVFHGFVRNQGNAWDWLQSRLSGFLDETSMLPPETVRARIAEGALDEMDAFGRILGTRTAEMHCALAAPTPDPDFQPVMMDAHDLDAWRLRVREGAERALAILGRADLSEIPEAQALMLDPDAVIAAVESCLPDRPFGHLTRIHGDYHLGQVLVVMNDVWVIDFEGEPSRGPDGRRAKDSPLRDVAGMLRSFDYAARSALARIGSARPEAAVLLEPVMVDWRDRTAGSFLAGYFGVIEDSPVISFPDADAMRLLDLFVIEKACYEIAYEAANRPGWLHVPVRGLASIVAGG